MRYAGIAVGAIVTIVVTMLLTGIAAVAVMSSGADLDAMRATVWTTVGFEALYSLARILGGFTAGMMAKGTETPQWVIGGGAASGLAAALLLLLLSLFDPSTGFSAGDMLPPLLWPIQGAIGGTIAWWVVRPR